MSKDIRLAAPAEETELMEICRELDGENGLFPMNEDEVREAIRKALNKQEGMVWVIGDPGTIEAGLYLVIDRQWCSSQWMLQERFNYCRPPFRKSDNSKRLMIHAKDCALKLGLPLTIGVLSNTRTEAKMRLYRRQFPTPAGGFYVFNTPWDKPDGKPVQPEDQHHQV